MPEVPIVPENCRFWSFCFCWCFGGSFGSCCSLVLLVPLDVSYSAYFGVDWMPSNHPKGAGPGYSALTFCVCVCACVYVSICVHTYIYIHIIDRVIKNMRSIAAPTSPGRV